MYIEKNGFLVVNEKELSFLTEDRDFADNLDLAEIFSTNQSALEAIEQFVDTGHLIVLRYNQTIWIDKDAEQPKTKESCCTECKCEPDNNLTYSDIETAILEKYSN